MPESSHFKDMYINLDNYRHQYRHVEYEYSASLSRLKEMIDERVVKVTNSVV